MSTIAPDRRDGYLAHRLPAGHCMMTKAQVEGVLERVRPFLQADGGDIVVVGISGNTVDVRLLGTCAGCPSAEMTLQVGVAAALRDAIPEFESLRAV
jgi:Fe-S cluster biogenesis protein NfuA